MSRLQLLGWISIASACGIVVFSWDASRDVKVRGDAGPGGMNREKSKTVAGQTPRGRWNDLPHKVPESLIGRPERVAKNKPSATEYEVSAPAGSSRELQATAEWIDRTARERLQEMTDRYKLTPEQQARIYPVLASRLPGFSNDMIVNVGSGGPAIAPGIIPGKSIARGQERNPAGAAMGSPRPAAGSPGRPGSAEPGLRGGVAATPSGSTGKPASPPPPASLPAIASPTSPSPVGKTDSPAATQPGPVVLPGSPVAPANDPIPRDTSLAGSGESVTGDPVPQETSAYIPAPDSSLEDELFALLDPDQQALLMDDTLDSARWWEDVVAQLEADLDAVISATHPAPDGGSGSSDFEQAPDGNLFDLLGN